tara:strand:- start:726 stop:1010 length:285 start_codon:yes stop_codon:yes gene_type:complete
MTKITINQMPTFKKSYKKLPKYDQQKINDAINEIIENPEIGIEKKGDLEGVHVYKFKIHHQEMLLAYEWNPHERLLLALGVHENFYRDLKRKMK